MGQKKLIFTIGKWFAFIAVILFILLLPALFPNSNKIGLFLQAIGVVSATFAIWGEQIKLRFFGPKLLLSLFKPEGEETSISNPENTPIRFYHFKVESIKKGLIAKNVQVILLYLDSPFRGGNNKKTKVGGRLPFKWAFRDSEAVKQDKKILYYSTIGPDDLCDLACLPKGGRLTILADPWNLIRDQLVIGANQRAEVEAVAIADNAQSNHLKLELFWDGQWPTDDEDAPNHIVIKEVK